MLLYTIKLYQKEVVENFSFNELKTEKVKFFIQSPTKIFCIKVFNIGGCLASCLTFRPFFIVRPFSNLATYNKKRVILVPILFF